MSTNDLYYIRAIDGQELEIPDISDLLEQQAVKLPDDDMSMPFQISGETMKKLDEAAQKLATQITAVMAIIGGNLVYAAEALREYAECGASLEVLLAEYEEMAKLGETLNPEQLISLRSLYYAKTRRRVALRRTEIVRANDKSFDGQKTYLKQAKISKRLPRSDMTFNTRFGRLCGQETAPAQRRRAHKQPD